MGFGWTIQIDYTSRTAVEPARFAVGRKRHEALLPAGNHTVWLPGDATYESVRISGLGGATDFCVRRLSVGSIELDY